jgi:hypothetical protein
MEIAHGASAGPDGLEQVALQATAIEVAAKHVSFEKKKHDHDEHEDGNDLRDRYDGDDERRLLNAFQNHEVEEPYPNGGDEDCPDRVTIAENREKRAHCCLDRNPLRDVADATADAVSKGGQKPRVVTKASFGIRERIGIQVGFALGERLGDAGQHVHASAGDQPGDDCAKRSGSARERARE